MQAPNVHFYILNAAHERDARRFACQLIEASYAKGDHVYIQTRSKEEAEQLDSLLWTYSDISFLPHKIYTPISDFNTAIEIGFDAKLEHQADVLINLSREVPSFYKQFNSVMEIVFSGPLVQQLARNRYRQYRDEGCEISTYKK